MLVFTSEIEKNFKNCSNKLHKLFSNFSGNTKLEKQINAVEHYYYDLFLKVKSPKAAQDITTQYDSFVTQLTQVKNGELSVAQAIKNANNGYSSRRGHVFFDNLVKTCGLIFWSATAVTLAASLYFGALPLFAIQPVFGVIVGIALAGLLLKTLAKALSCFTEFKSTNQSKEAALISFFKSDPSLQEPQEPKTDNVVPFNERSQENDDPCTSSFQCKVIAS